MYDDLADVYDRFIDWPNRLAREIPLLGDWLGDARRVADVACGTGQHALALAQAGYEVVGFDASAAALERAGAAGGAVRFHQAAFGACSAVGEAPFDAVICLGNSLPHVLTVRELRGALADFGRLLRPGGRLLAHLRNLPLARQRDDRWLPLREHTDADGTQWLFERLYDYLPAERVRFHFIALHRPPAGRWSRRVQTTLLRGWTAAQLLGHLGHWGQATVAASLAGEPFDAAASADLYLTATA